ncbi:hypothetical protein C6990_06340 [Nitrosopumilus sp. b3]|uniref:hypothetical protein n=1 Tax=Nitrosopumilus sp. b3 TaxID=2109909 RepID=UPI0015F3925C|nr:hypothetical protein [Nitrosopumilus sp. b3]KAF6246735.1 hypothetical protein C6990_06340 [Nitrosopumilus sp. b3]
MKILVPSPVSPNNKSVRITYVSEIIKDLKKLTNLDFYLFVYQPDKLNSFNFPDFNILDIHDFTDAIDCLDKIQPDCVMIGPNYEPIQYAFSLACKKLKIPLVSFYYFGYGYEQSDSMTRYAKIIFYLRNIFSNSLPTDSDDQKFFLRRLTFIIYKIRFLNRTKKSAGYKHNFIQKYFSSFYNYFLRKELPITKFPVLHLLPDPSWIEPLKKIGIPQEKLCVTGSPYWDQLYRNSKNYVPKQTVSKKISILIITDALLEHGIWNKNKFTSFITNLINELSKKSEFSFSFKIHPASENKTKYHNLFQKLRNDSKIYQNENIWDILGQYDLVITFGFSTIHSELSLVGAKMILLDFNFNFPLFPFVKEGLEFGNVMKCTDISHLNDMIIDFTNNANISNKSFNSTKNFLYKFDGKSGLRVSEELIKIINQNLPEKK